MEHAMNGKVLKFGDDINTDIISPPQYMELAIEEAAMHAMAPLDESFSLRVKAGDILVAGKNFGSGSSRETAPLALKYLGIQAVVATFFARIFFRNAINIGLPVFECPETDRIGEGDMLEIFPEKGLIKNTTKNEQYECIALPTQIMDIVRAGGLMAYWKDKH